MDEKLVNVSPNSGANQTSNASSSVTPIPIVLQQCPVSWTASVARLAFTLLMAAELMQFVAWRIIDRSAHARKTGWVMKLFNASTRYKVRKRGNIMHNVLKI